MADTANILTMKFGTADNKTRVINVQPCKPNTSEAQARALMDSIISGGAFAYQPAEKLGATITQRMTATLF